MNCLTRWTDSNITFTRITASIIGQSLADGFDVYDGCDVDD